MIKKRYIMTINRVVRHQRVGNINCIATKQHSKCISLPPNVDWSYWLEEGLSWWHHICYTSIHLDKVARKNISTHLLHNVTCKRQLVLIDISWKMLITILHNAIPVNHTFQISWLPHEACFECIVVLKALIKANICHIPMGFLLDT